jgi:hypothetical protein
MSYVSFLSLARFAVIGSSFIRHDPVCAVHVFALFPKDEPAYFRCAEGKKNPSREVFAVSTSTKTTASLRTRSLRNAEELRVCVGDSYEDLHSYGGPRGFAASCASLASLFPFSASVESEVIILCLRPNPTPRLTILAHNSTTTNYTHITTIMSEEQQQTPKSPVLCKMGCGFFGSDATGNCCSKCWMASLKVTHDPAPTATTSSTPPATAPFLRSPVANLFSVVEENDDDRRRMLEDEPMEICGDEQDVKNKAPVQKKKKKRTSYKAMMAGMMHAQDESYKAEKEREKLSQGLGGGAFTKVEKI